mgnify:FL=1|jgi:membrane-associated phospholipid phosphatase
MIATIRSHLKGHLLTAEIFVFAVVVLTLVAADVLYPSTEVFLVALVLLAIINSKARAFAIDFAPFIVLIFSYDSLRNFADDLTGAEIHVRDLIIWERSLFGGGLPGYWIQQNLWGLPITPLLDVLTNTLYLSHFMSPLVVSALLWRRSPNEYWAFALGLVALSYAGFITYILFPAAPPWWATHRGYLRTMPITLDHFVVPADVVSAGPNPVAAMPSLHTAYPVYIALVAIATWGKRGLPVICLPLGVAFSTFYLGHHWVIDALVGAGYAAFFFGTVYLYLRRNELSLVWLSRVKQVLVPHT